MTAVVIHGTNSDSTASDKTQPIKIIGGHTLVQIASVAAGVSIGSGLPDGTYVSEADIAATVTDATLTLSAPAKGVRLTLMDGTVSTPSLFAVVCFDPPSAAVRTAWLDTTTIGPRHKILKDKSLEITFKDESGAPTTVASMGYDFNAATAGSFLSVEIVT